MSLKVSEIFRSIQGETSYVGYPFTFVRLSGCNLRCRYCDTAYAQEDGEDMSVDEILEEESKHDYPHVSVTGGEPLIQEETPRLVEAFLDRGKTVVVETNGTRDISLLPDGAVKIMDIKCPSSGHSHEFQWENVWRLSRQDEVKFVCANRHDYEWARGIIRDRFEITKTKVLFSPVFGELPPRNLIEWILEDGLNVRFQLQIHKFIWPHDTRGV